MKFIYALALLPALLLNGCSPKAKVEQSHFCSYKRLEGKIQFYEGVGYELEIKGKTSSIEILSSGREQDVYEALENSIRLINGTALSKHNKIYAIGWLSTCSHTVILGDPERKGSIYYGLSKEEYTDIRRNFIFEGWYIKKPFIEVHWIDDSNIPQITKRTSLKFSDFGTPYVYKTKLHLTPQDLKRHVR